MPSVPVVLVQEPVSKSMQKRCQSAMASAFLLSRLSNRPAISSEANITRPLFAISCLRKPSRVKSSTRTCCVQEPKTVSSGCCTANCRHCVLPEPAQGKQVDRLLIAWQGSNRGVWSHCSSSCYLQAKEGKFRWCICSPGEGYDAGLQRVSKSTCPGEVFLLGL